MTIDELRRLKEGEKIRFTGEHKLLTKNKIYKVRITNVGRIIKNDNDFGLFLFDNDLYKSFTVSPQ